jgi:predicted AAA+ superfamily ATPase
VLRRRLFKRIDEGAIEQVIEEYRALWHGQRDVLAPEATKAETLTDFRDSHPLHPDVLETFTSKTATLANFQRVRGMLRILSRTISRLWELKPADATAIHLHHIDPGYEPVRQEFVTGSVSRCMYRLSAAT